jgi:hypothetical protein
MVRSNLIGSVVVAALVLATAFCGCIKEEEGPAPPAPNILDTLPGPKGAIVDAIDEVGDPRLAAESMSVAKLFNISFPEAAALVAKRLGGNNTTTIHIWGDPHVQENIFSEVIYHTPNAGDPIAAALSGRTATAGTLSSDRAFASAVMAYGTTYNGRNAGWAMTTGFGLGGTTAGTSAFQVTGFLYCSPIVLDMDGDGKLAASGGNWLPHPGGWTGDPKPFDIDGDGCTELTEWVGPGDGLLATTPTPRSGLDLLGTAGGWSDGFANLARRDLDKDGHLKLKELDGLYVWLDSDGSAVADAGEVKTVADSGIKDISLTHRYYRASFTVGREQRLLWDWYPSAVDVIGAPASGGGTKPTVPDMAVIGLSRTAREASSGMAAGERWGADPSTLASLGLADASLVAVMDNGTAILLDKETGTANLASGRSWSLVLLSGGTGKNLKADRFPLPVSNVLSVVPTENMRAAVVVADSGTLLLEVSLTNGSAYKLVETPINAGKAGFMFGAASSIANGSFYNWGAFFDEKGQLVEECIASFPLEGGKLVAHHDLRALFATTKSSPTIGSVYSNTSAMFAAHGATGVDLWAISGSGLKRVDGGAVFRGMWSASRGSLYLVDRGTGKGTEAMLYRTGASPVSLGTGDYSYPMLSGHSKAAAVATYDWANLTMTYRIAHPANKWALDPVLSAVPIGPLRLSDEGVCYAYLSSQGLTVGIIGASAT